MLAQNFKTPAVLGISDVEFESLVKVLGMLERGELDDRFDMREVWCGTIGCMLGWAHAVSHGAAFPQVAVYIAGHDLPLRGIPAPLRQLFGLQRGIHLLGGINAPQAAIALRNYLTHGEARWAEALESA